MRSIAGRGLLLINAVFLNGKQKAEQCIAGRGLLLMNAVFIIIKLSNPEGTAR